MFCAGSAQFTDSPVDTDVTEGDSLVLNCSYTNPADLFWRRDDSRIQPSNTDFVVESVDSNTIRLRLSPSADRRVHSGDYQCVAVDGGTEMVENFTITVQCKLCCCCSPA